MMIVVGYTEPIIGKAEGNMNLINEAFVLLITYHLYQFTEFTTDLKMRDLVGTSMVYTTFANVGLNILVVGVNTAFFGCRKVKLKWLGWKQRKAIAKQLETKLQARKERRNQKLEVLRANLQPRNNDTRD